jgi:hypothetical protein
MSNQVFEHHPYIKRLKELNQEYENRSDFHRHAGSILQEMGADKEFLKAVVKRNFDDEGYKEQVWSLYNIPFFFIYECTDFLLKIHFFPAMKDYKPGQAAHCIHHHNNYILTTAAIYGSGYESMLFDKKIEVDEKTLLTRMKVARHFTQKEFPVHTIDSWEPHVVFMPPAFSTTLQIWTPDKKRKTDALRNNPVLKALKAPLRKIIYWCGLERKVGISAQNTYQWYPDGDHFKAILEEEYFGPTRNAKGPEVDLWSMQNVFIFIQRMGLVDHDYLKELRQRPDTPEAYLPWIDMVLQGEQIPDTWHRDSINIPRKTYRAEDIYTAAGMSPLPLNA